jgi:class 3 adenylate cyclase
VIAQVPREVAYRSLFEMRRIVLLVLAAAALGGALLGVFFARRITSPIGRLRAFAEKLAARDFGQKVTIETRDELAVLGDALSGAAADLAASEAKLGRELAIRQDLGRYLPAQLVDKVVRREQDLALGGERRTITVLFADVVAFTPLAERLGAEAVTRLLNDLFTVLTEIVFRSGGTIDKFMGDCVMAVWGAPAELGDHAPRAVRAAQDMLRWVEAANAGWQEVHGARVQLAIGVHSGEAIVGNLGSKQRMEYTAIGDTVNVAARLESVARPEQILCSRATRELVGDAVEFVPLGERRLAGLGHSVDLFEVRND